MNGPRTNLVGMVETGARPGELPLHCTTPTITPAPSNTRMLASNRCGTVGGYHLLVIGQTLILSSSSYIIIPHTSSSMIWNV